jgi:hypothetical protein
MEGIKAFFNDWGALLALFLTIPLAIIANVMTPGVQNWWGRRSAKSATQRFLKLSSELNMVQGYQRDKPTFITSIVVSATLRAFFNFLIYVAFMLAGIFVSIVRTNPLETASQSTSFAFYVVVASSAYVFLWNAVKDLRSTIRLHKNVTDFNAYKAKTEKEMIDLARKAGMVWPKSIVPTVSSDSNNSPMTANRIDSSTKE